MGPKRSLGKRVLVGLLVLLFLCAVAVGVLRYQIHTD